MTVAKILPRETSKRRAREVNRVRFGVEQHAPALLPRAIVEVVIFVRQERFVEAAELLPERLAKDAEGHGVNGARPDFLHGEIGDMCAWQTKKIGTYTVQLEWSNKAGRCV